MKKILILILSLATFSVVAAEPPRNGEIRHLDDGQAQAWIASQGQWGSVVEFWNAYAATNGGLTWGRGSEYPEYAKVKEHDTFMVEAEGGPCLMEFFHERWRRANDVRRWDTGFTDVEGCPNVFK